MNASHSPGECACDTCNPPEVFWPCGCPKRSKTHRHVYRDECHHTKTLTTYEVGSGGPFVVYCADCGLTLKEVS